MTVETVDHTRFRTVLGHFCTGVTVVTTHDGASPAGFACQSFAALSLDPPLVLFCPSKHSRTWPVVQRAGRFAVNVLAEEQRELSAAFGARGADKFGTVNWTPAPSGSPVLAGVLAWIDCELEAVYEAGDHYVVIGRVIALGETSAARPLLFYQGRYTAPEPLRTDLGALLAWAGPDDWL
ncbi:flavin reductase family protein [Amycolatopsis acidiphila]|uniref:Flavin reductase family protein n=1 Tax=Amycolatopsis acidiphila TaxID=715473 RepID=A0A558AEX3_9PSEU|nr:3-hydroxy-9,10-secoandrosta-1,3,5(10)-triene-9,17-dione monooxygenase reductase subunit [Amycolatopsis acidiphila]TVT22817.1 flavin reductase family protein [Amycolatopsis acidiphila]UIJ58170.1 flavin reductase family protein [Amycolatopsis acidiphila]GHG69657.1 monooxygenase [Amycolatopsis acidiphila]